ncbi:MAG: hypothetical protein ACRDYA_21670 [Egibacteraceae bacterium]
MAQQPEAATASEQLEDANLFIITGPIMIHYSRTTLPGPPAFSYKDAELDLNFSGPAITQADSPMGELVTVILENVADGFIRTFTLIVPKIRLYIGDQVPFDTLGIETIDRSGAFTLPPGPTGVLKIYRSHQLQGTAQFVIP